MKKVLYLVPLLYCTLSPNLHAGGGPDAYGYVWLATADPGGPALAWKDISTTGTLVTGLADDNSAPGYFNIGFPFHYYWNDYTQIKIGSNGWISFSNTSNIASCFPTIPFPGGAEDYLAAYMSDLNFTGAGNPGQCRIWTNNIDSCIISYTNVPFWIASAPGWSGSNTFQIILNGQDSSITYQYQSCSAFTPAAGCVDMTVGIENSTGSIGLSVYNDVQPLSNHAIKFYYPTPVLLSIKDVKANWNQNDENKGPFYLTGIFDLWSNVKSSGNTDITSSISATGNIKNSGGTTVYTGTQTFSSGLPFGVDSSWLYLPHPNINTAGEYQFHLITSNVDDINPGNNTLITEIDLRDPCAASMMLGYTNASINSGSINWNGGAVDDGVGVYIKPPAYPAEINSIEVFVSVAGSDGFTAKIHDDDGPGGTAGTVLFSQTVASASLTSGTWYTINLASPVTINDGGFYLASYQSGVTFFIGTDNVVPISHQCYEILDGAWADFRFNSDQDVMLRCNVSGYDSDPVADFSIDNTPGSLAVNFTHATSGATSLSWDFGDFSTSSAVSPSHLYTGPGCYPVTLIATNACGADTATQTVCVCLAPGANFTWLDSLLTVDFIDTGTPATTNWFWDFGDGSTDTTANPTHTYSANGTYNVCLIITNCLGSDTLCQTLTINCTPVADFTAMLSGLTMDISYTGTAADSIAWDFGDGSTGSGMGTTHTYSTSGVYYVCVYATNVCGTDTFCDSTDVLVRMLAANNNESFTVSPNPAATEISIAGTAQGEVTLILRDMYGREVEVTSISSKGTYTQVMSLAALPAGVYMLEARTQGQSGFKKVVKQ